MTSGAPAWWTSMRVPPALAPSGKTTTNRPRRPFSTGFGTRSQQELPAIACGDFISGVAEGSTACTGAVFEGAVLGCKSSPPAEESAASELPAPIGSEGRPDDLPGGRK